MLAEPPPVRARVMTPADLMVVVVVRVWCRKSVSEPTME